jgi:hypothetical protein
MGRPLIEYDIRMRSRMLACKQGRKKRKELVNSIHLFKHGMSKQKKSARAGGRNEAIHSRRLAQ